MKLRIVLVEVGRITAARVEYFLIQNNAPTKRGGGIIIVRSTTNKLNLA